MTGHTRTAITQDLYTHVSASMQRAAADALDLVIEPRPRTKPEEREASMPGQGVLFLVP
ncbi:MAG: hypothetical protein QOH29_242 [Actinomycetota bacterium]|jgi:hypothetical protein|nr:hypothetical protein [Actinomycetota bacterium]